MFCVPKMLALTGNVQYGTLTVQHAKVSRHVHRTTRVGKEKGVMRFATMGDGFQHTARITGHVDVRQGEGEHAVIKVGCTIC